MTTIPLLGTCSLGLSLGRRCFAVYGVDEVVRLLEEHWLNKTGAHYKQTLKTCRLALLRSGPSEVACEHLVATCLKAGIPHQVHSIPGKDQLPLFAVASKDANDLLIASALR